MLDQRFACEALAAQICVPRPLFLVDLVAREVAGHGPEELVFPSPEGGCYAATASGGAPSTVLRQPPRWTA